MAPRYGTHANEDPDLTNRKNDLYEMSKEEFKFILISFFYDSCIFLCYIAPLMLNDTSHSVLGSFRAKATT